MGLGDVIERALSSIGITKSRVEKWIGAPCNCEERKQKLNRLGYWAARVLSGRKAGMEEHLDAIMDDAQSESKEK